LGKKGEKMKRYILFIAVLASVFLFNITAFAALSMEAYIDGTNVTGSSYDLLEGDSITLDLFISFDEPLVSGGFQIAYDNSAIDVTNVAAASDSPWFATMTNAWEGGLIDYAVVGPLGGAVAPADSQLFTSIDITGLGSDAAPLYLLATGTDDFVTNAGVVLDGDIEGMLLVEFNQVPIPGAAIMLGSALIGLVGIRSRKNC
jgi:hypothetical protein